MTTGRRGAVSTVRVGERARWSETLVPTSKEAPADAESVSHLLLARAGEGFFDWR